VAGLEALRASDFAGTKYTFRLNAPRREGIFEQEMARRTATRGVTQEAMVDAKVRPLAADTTAAFALTHTRSFHWDWRPATSASSTRPRPVRLNLATSRQRLSEAQRYRFLDSIAKHDEDAAPAAREQGLRSAAGRPALTPRSPSASASGTAAPPVLRVTTFYIFPSSFFFFFFFSFFLFLSPFFPGVVFVR